jgi:predicted AlkP superfamily pyrophosphatase or phosphodiesterase
MIANLSRRAFAAFSAVALAALLAAGCATAPVATVPKPKLVVLLVVDGLPQWQVTGYRDQLGPDGLNRFLQHGAWFADAHHVHAHTATAPGHATFLTGAAPHRTGIIGNDWRDPSTGAMTYCTQDEAHAYLGHKTVKLDGTSPKNLLVESLGDVLRGADPRSKTVAISGKDRGAILPAGRTGTAYMYMKQTGQFVSSTYYMKEHPAWVTAFNAAKPADRYFKASWKPLLPEMAYARSVPDGQAWYSKPGKLPRIMGEKLDAPGPLFYDELYASPFVDALTLDFARAAIEGERLGEDDAPDILSVSLSGHDYVNHAWGAESRLSHDHLLQLDNLLAAFFRDLDKRLGRDNYLVVLTSDHGFTPAAEYLKAKGIEAGRQSSTEVLAKLNAGLVKRFGEGTWARAVSAHGILLDNALIAQRGVDRAALEAEAKRLLLAEPSLVAAFTRGEILDPLTPAAPYLQLVRRSHYPGRSADIQMVLRPNWIFASSSGMATHGAPHPYDTHVPLLAWGPRWIATGRRDGRAEIVDIAPTLAKVLGIRAPAASEGKPLPVGP